MKSVNIFGLSSFILLVPYVTVLYFLDLSFAGYDSLAHAERVNIENNISITSQSSSHTRSGANGVSGITSVRSSSNSSNGANGENGRNGEDGADGAPGSSGTSRGSVYIHSTVAGEVVEHIDETVTSENGEPISINVHSQHVNGVSTSSVEVSNNVPVPTIRKEQTLTHEQENVAVVKEPVPQDSETESESQTEHLTSIDEETTGSTTTQIDDSDQSSAWKHVTRFFANVVEYVFTLFT